MLNVERCFLSFLVATTVGCSAPPPPSAQTVANDPVDEVTAGVVLNRVAESYVQLVLALGQHDPDYVDAYYGPDEWSRNAATEQISLNGIKKRAGTLLSQLAREPAPPSNAMLRLRYDYLIAQLRAVVARVGFVEGTRLSFDDESMVLYDAVAPVTHRRDFERVLRDLDDELPGRGDIQGRLVVFQSRFVVRTDRLEQVFAAAIDACREQTAMHIDLPDEESFTVEYVTGKPWSGYNWYQGNFRSVIQVNTDFPIYIDRALDLACHEGYPGHHVYNVLLEKHLTQDRGWVEFTVYPLFSPQSLIAEGSANYGIEVAFPGARRIDFERETLFPLAGLDGAEAERYARVMQLLDRLDYAGNEAARGYLDGEMSRDDTVDWLTRFNLMTTERATQRVDFFDRYRSYVINYNLGQDLVRDYVERELADGALDADRWNRFAELLSSPRLPSGLRVLNADGDRR